MSSFDDPAATPLTHDPPRYRAPVGLPLRDEGRTQGMIVSVIIHALIIFLLIVPFMLPSSVIERMQQGAGGAGPAGGGGGGQQGTGGEKTVETLRFVKLAPKPVPTPTTLPPVPTPVKPKVELPKVAPVVPATPVPKPQSAVPAPSAQVASAVSGAGGGSGRDGSGGAGPGSGGGVGAGIGTGRGGATGPGTGGGSQVNYSPQPVELFLPPLPFPSSVRGFRFTAEFDVDSTGRVLDVKFTETPDAGYNRRLQSMLRQTRFRPGTRPDGTPVRMKAQLGYDF